MQRYNPIEIEKKWQEKWDRDETYKVDLSDTTKPKYYGFSMLPGITGAGIHIGHGRTFQFSDIKVRAKRQQGYNAYNPVGWDSFGLPVENYAIKIGKKPREAHDEAKENFIRQLKRLGYSYDWSKEISTADPEYYRWTQWIFNKLYEHGLAYQKESPQWWCETDQTVLANEQVEGGKCWRCGNPVTKKNLKQWFFKITEYADEMLEATDDLNWTEMVKTMQKNWIGKSKGAEVDFTVAPTLKSAVIIHGKGNTPEDNWYPWLKDELTKCGMNVISPQFPQDSSSAAKEWNEIIEKQNLQTDETVYIGHSRGAMALLRWVESLDDNQQVKKLVLIAPNYDYQPERNDSGDFYIKALDYEKIKKICSSITIVHSADDKYAPIEAGIQLASKLNATLVRYENEGHFGSGIKTAPQILSAVKDRIRVFTTAHDTIYGATFMVLAPEHPLVEMITTDEHRASVHSYVHDTQGRSEIERQDTKRAKTGVFTGAHAINPVNGNKVPIWIADYVLAGYGTGAVMAVPGEDARDHEFAKKYNLPIIYTTDRQEFVDYQLELKNHRKDFKLANSDEFDGLDFEEGRKKILEKLESLGAGKENINYKMRDWLISRQRYWGAPIPMVHCEKDGAVPVPDDQLPVVLPDVDDYKPKGGATSVLATVEDWVNTTCPKCGGPAKRETDTMDGYACSSWYFLRYIDPFNDKQAWDPEVAKAWMPTDFYNGADHAVAHLLYARFWTRFFYKLGLVPKPEPFERMMYNAYIMAPDGLKMSKSKGNVIDPLEIMDSGYGADSLRVYEMFIAPYDMEAPWDTRGVPGTYRFLNRTWTLTQEYLANDAVTLSEEAEKEILTVAHKTIKKVTEDIEHDKFNTAVSSMMEAVNTYYKLKETHGIGQSKAWKFAIESLLQVLAPFAPHITEELWSQLGHDNTVHIDTWPSWEEAFLQSSQITIIVQMNGKLRAKLEVSADATEEEIIRLAQNDEKVATQLQQKEVRKTIYVPQKLVNFVV